MDPKDSYNEEDLYINNSFFPTFPTSSPKGNDRSPENKQVFSNSSQVSLRFFQLVKGSQLCSPWLDKILTSTRVVTLLQICKE